MNRTNLLIISIIFLFILSFSGCLNDDESKNEIYFSIYYSSSSNENETFNLTIITNNIEVFNETVTPKPGHKIYNEKASGYEYFIKVRWNYKTSEISFTPNGQNTVSIEIVNGNIGLQEITD